MLQSIRSHLAAVRASRKQTAASLKAANIWKGRCWQSLGWAGWTWESVRSPWSWSPPRRSMTSEPRRNWRHMPRVTRMASGEERDGDRKDGRLVAGLGVTPGG